MPTLNDILTANGDYTPVSGYPVDDKYENDSPVINVYDRTIGEIVGDTSTSGENVSQYLTFRIPRHPDHYDLIENGTNIRILYRLEDDTGEDVVPVNVVANEDYIIFGWKIPLVVTVNPGVVTFIIHAYKSENNLITYHYKTLPKTYRILETMETDVVVPEIEMYNLAEAYARGTITDVFGHTRPVEEGEPGYHDNSKYYKELAGTSKIDAETAKNAAEAAQGAAETAQQAAENARDQAVAIVGGEYVSYGQTQSLNDTQKNKARENIGATGPNGYYPNMTVGLSENFVGTGEPTRRIFNYDTAGGSADISDGNAEIEKMYGGTVVWNQLASELGTSSWSTYDVTVTYADGVATIVPSALYGWIREKGVQAGVKVILPSHKYLVMADIKAVSVTTLALFISDNIKFTYKKVLSATTSWANYSWVCNIASSTVADSVLYGVRSDNASDLAEYQLKNFMLFDLTQMFGSTIADYIYSLEQSQAGAGVAWFKKLFPLDYYPYDKGTLLNVNPAGIKTVGFNAYDKATGKAELIGGNQYQITGTYTSLSYSTGEILTPDSTGCFTPTKTGELTVTGGGANTCVHLTWSGYRNGDYEDYWTRTRDINIQPYFPDGLKRAGTVYDEISKDKAIKRIGVVDLGSLTWQYLDGLFLANIRTGGQGLDKVFGNMICPMYILVDNNDYVNWADKSMRNTNVPENPILRIKNNAYTDVAAFKAAMSGVMLYYELAEPVETQIDPPLNLLYQVSDFGTEQFLGAGATEPKTLPIIADIVYDVNYRDTIKNLPKNYAKVRGYYPDLYTGLADNLIDRKGNGTPQEISYRTSCGDDSITDDGNGVIQSIFGNTVVWNQLVSAMRGSGSEKGLTFTKNADGSLNISGTITEAFNYNYVPFTFTGLKFKRDGRKYLLMLNKPIPYAWGVSGYTATISANSIGGMWSNNEGGNWVNGLIFRAEVGTTIDIQNLRAMVFDLTQMFGAGNEPSTLDDSRIKWIKDYANEYPEYNIGELISYNGSGIKTVGFNQWDEEWEVGTFNYNTGEVRDRSDAIRSKNYIPVIPDTSYYITKASNLTSNNYRFMYYDADKTFIGDSGWFPNDGVNGTYSFKTSNKCHYMKFTQVQASTYNHDICINLSWSGYRNGEYEPYWSRMLNLPILTYFSDGMKSAGSVRDELTKDKAVKRIGVVDLGTLDWAKGTHSGVDYFVASNVPSGSRNGVCPIYTKTIHVGVAGMQDKEFLIYNDANQVFIVDSSYTDAATFKQAMSGVMLYYELAEPIETTITPPLDLTYKVADFGTEESITEGKSTPFIGIIKYSDDFTRGLVNMPKNYDTTASLDALAASLSAMLTSALDGTVTITRGAYDPATKKYEWSCQFTKNQVN